MDSRKLTLNEINLASKVFGGSILYIDVKIFHKKYIFFQPDETGMTPNGNIYIDGKIIKDYGSSIVEFELKAFFIHEMVHVWQKHNGILNPVVSAIANSIRHGFNYNKAYKYTLDAKKDLLDYRIEQQAQIIEDYTRVLYLNIDRKGAYLQNEGSEAEINKLYQSVLSKFLSQPSYPHPKKN